MRTRANNSRMIDFQGYNRGQYELATGYQTRTL
jgi:hypothetical protein